MTPGNEGGGGKRSRLVLDGFAGRLVLLMLHVRVSVMKEIKISYNSIYFFVILQETSDKLKKNF